ncbi:MAG: NAD(P)H-binding protein [Sphingomonas sp.]
MTKTILVLGATGGIGGETARALLRHGWKVRGLARKLRPGLDPGVEWIEGDAMDHAAVSGAARGVSAILHAVNPPGYRNWAKLVLPMLDNSIAAALENGARLALPGTIYNYDPRSVALAEVETPQHPNTRKGAIRAEMERRLAETPGLRALVLRAGDFFGAHAGNSWLAQGIVTPGRPVRSVVYPGPHRHRPRLGLPARHGGELRAAARSRSRAARLRALSFPRLCGRRRAFRAGDRRGGGQSAAQGQEDAVGPAPADRALQHDDARADRDAPLLAPPARARQSRAGRRDRRGAAHPARTSDPHDAGGAGVSGGKLESGRCADARLARARRC